MTAGSVTVTYLNTIVPEAVEWYWRGRLAKAKLSCFDGMPGLGKTTVSLDLIARFTRGDCLPGETRPVPKTRVGILSDEDGVADTTVPRLELAGADLGMICQLTGTGPLGSKRSLVLPDDLPTIAQIIRQENLGYLHIDPLAAHAGKGVNLYIDQDVRTQIMGPLAHLAAESGTTIVLVRHPTKAQFGPAMLRGGGSVGIIGAARFGLLFGHHPHDENTRVIASTKCNIGPMPDSLLYKLNGVQGSEHARVWWDPLPSELSADDLLPTPAQPSTKKVGAAEEWLGEYLELGPQPANDVIAAGDLAGHSERTLRRAKIALQIASKRIGGADGIFYWCLPGQDPKAEPWSTDSMPGFGFTNGADDTYGADQWTG